MEPRHGSIYASSNTMLPDIGTHLSCKYWLVVLPKGLGLPLGGLKLEFVVIVALFISALFILF